MERRTGSNATPRHNALVMAAEAARSPTSTMDSPIANKSIGVLGSGGENDRERDMLSWCRERLRRPSLIVEDTWQECYCRRGGARGFESITSLVGVCHCGVGVTSLGTMSSERHVVPADYDSLHPGMSS